MSKDMGASAEAETGSREAGLASCPGPSGFDPARLEAWIEMRMDVHRADRSEARNDGDEYSQAAATSAMLELLELRSWLAATARPEGIAQPSQDNQQ